MPLVTVTPSTVRIVSLATRGLPGGPGPSGVGATGPAGERGATGSRGATGYTDAVNSGLTTTDITGIIKGQGGFTVVAVAGTDYIRAIGTAATQAAAGDHLHTGTYAPVTHSHAASYAAIVHSHSASYAPLSSVLRLGTSATQAAYGNHLHTGVYEPRGTAAATVAQHESNYTHSHIALNSAHRLTVGNPHSTTAASVGAEPALGNPAATAYALYSSLSGQRYWGPAATGGGTGGGTPSDTVTSGRVFGTSSAAGGSSTYSRGDHQHGTPSLGTSATQAAAGNHTHAQLHDPVTVGNGLRLSGQAISLQFGTAATQPAGGDHLHSGVYAPVSHSHAASYAALVHSHAASYAPLSSVLHIGTAATQAAAGNHAHIGTYEPVLGNPAVSGYVLTSTTGGVRSWTEMSGGTASRWTALSGYAATPASTSKITFTSDQSAYLPSGRRLQYQIAGSTYYGQVVNSGATWLNLRGIRLFGNVSNLKYGDRSTADQLHIAIPGAFSDGTNASLIASDLYDVVRNNDETTYVVGFGYVEKTVDTGAAQPNVNVRVNGNRVSAANSGVGPLCTAASQWTGVDVSATNYAWGYHQRIEADVTKGTNGDAADLSLDVILVKP